MSSSRPKQQQRKIGPAEAGPAPASAVLAIFFQ